MFKKRKFLIALLSTAVMTAGAFGIAACGGGETATPNEEYYAAYQLYVADENEAGRTPDSYQTWLENMLSEAKGQDGKSAYEIWKESPAGQASDMTEQQWLESLKGADGTGIASVELSSDGTKLIITYTDPSVPATEIELDDTFHKHTYGSVEVLIAGSAESAGLGYRECSVDGHIELVKLNPYKITVKKPDGTAAEGYTVTLGSATATTDSDGVAAFANGGSFGSMAIDVEAADGDNFGALTAYTSGMQTDYTIELATKLTSYDTVSEAGKYIVTIDWSYDYGLGSDIPGAAVIYFAADTDKNTHYAVSVDESAGRWYCDSSSSIYQHYLDTSKPAGYTHDLYIASGETAQIAFSFDESIYTDTNASVSYYVNVEKSEGPATGSLVTLPVTLSVGENNLTVQTEAISGAKSAYCVLPATWGETAKFNFTFGNGVTVNYYGYGDNALEALSAGTAEPQAVTSGVPVTASSWYDSYFIISTTDENGAANVTVEEYYDLGNANNPVVITELGNVKNTSANALVVDWNGSWFEYVCESTGKYVIEFTKGVGVSYFENEPNENGYYDENDDWHSYELGYIDQTKNIIELTAGTTYYFKLSLEDGLYDFNLRAYDAEQDAGCSADDLRAVTFEEGANSATLSVEKANTYMYFSLPVHGAGYYTVTVTGSEGSEVYFDASFTDGNTVYDRFHVSDENIYLMITAYETGYNLTVTYTAENEATDHTFTFKSGDTYISGVTVDVGYYIEQDYEQVFVSLLGEDNQGTTDENGSVTLNFAPCDYVLQISLPDDADYYIDEDALKVSFADDEESKTFEFESITDYVYTFKDAEGNAIEGIVLNLYYNEYGYYGYEKTLVDTATSGSDGTATLAAFASLAAQDGYYVEVTGTDDYDVATAPAFDSGTYAYEVTVSAKVTYIITVTDAESEAVDGLTVTVTDAKGNKATGTTNGNGVATLNTKLIPGEYKISCTGYTLSGTTSATETEVSVTATPIQATEITSDGVTIALTAEDEAAYYKATGSGYMAFSSPYIYIYVELNGEIVVSNKTYQMIQVSEGDIIRVWSDNPMPSMPDNNNCTVTFTAN